MLDLAEMFNLRMTVVTHSKYLIKGMDLRLMDVDSFKYSVSDILRREYSDSLDLERPTKALEELKELKVDCKVVEVKPFKRLGNEKDCIEASLYIPSISDIEKGITLGFSMAL